MDQAWESLGGRQVRLDAMTCDRQLGIGQLHQIAMRGGDRAGVR
jgi:hypothetical protein